jgi:hypothetical protein
MYYKIFTVNIDSDIVLVTMPPGFVGRPRAAARALHCTPPEAADLAVETQPDRLESLPMRGGKKPVPGIRFRGGPARKRPKQGVHP